MKKLVSLLLAVLMMAGTAAVLAESYPMTEETFTSEQGPVWFYRYYTEATDEILDLNLTKEWGDNWQFSKQPTVDNVYHSFCEWDGIQAMPGKWLGKAIDMVLVFVAPKDGKATLEPMSFVIKDDGNTWEPYLVQILHVTAGQEPVKLLGEDFVLTPYESAAIPLDLKAGDEVRFVVRSADNGGAAVSVMPVITYAD
ncbi:MAG: hypothetical protein AB9880_01630 [Christensenellales bacterium]